MGAGESHSDAVDTVAVVICVVGLDGDVREGNRAPPPLSVAVDPVEVFLRDTPFELEAEPAEAPGKRVVDVLWTVIALGTVDKGGGIASGGNLLAPPPPESLPLARPLRPAGVGE